MKKILISILIMLCLKIFADDRILILNNVPPYITIVADCSAIISLDGTYPINPPLGN